jgi:hypothetical protein
MAVNRISVAAEGPGVAASPRAAERDRGAASTVRKAPFELGPARERPDALEVLIADVDGYAHVREAAQHDGGVEGAAAEALGTREQQHQVGMIPGALLHGAPRQVVERLVFFPGGRRERRVAAFTPRRALGAGRCILNRRDEQDERKRGRREHRFLVIRSRNSSRTEGGKAPGW